MTNDPGPAEVINIHSPAMRYEEFFRQFHALKMEHGVHQPPEGVRETNLLAMWLDEVGDESRSVSPPPWVVTLVATAGRVLGYRLPDPT